MKIYVMTDLEGPAMVSQWAQTRDFQDAPQRHAEAKQLLTGEVNAAVDGILEADSEAEVIVWDAHGVGGGIDIMMFHPKAKLIARGKPNKPPYYLDESFDGLFFVGQHAMAGTEKAVLAHTYSSRTIEYFKINGTLVGEFGARAIMAGTFGVPTVFVSGDDKTIAEAQALVPDISAAIVKWGLAEELALHLSPVAARELIRETARETVGRIWEIPPLKVDPPYEQEIRVKEGCAIDHYLERGAERIDDRTVVLRSDNICDLTV